MLNPPLTGRQAVTHVYGNKNLGNAKRYKCGHCAYEVWDSFSSGQCSRKNGHGINKLYCKQHGKMVKE